MAVVNHEHLFEQADNLLLPSLGAPRQVALRRAISATYYGIFHFTLRHIADEFVGSSSRSTPRYALIYRSLDHRVLKDICSNLAKTTIPSKYGPFVPNIGFGRNIPAFATAVVELQDKRIRADYDPVSSFTRSDARASLETARSAVRRFEKAKSVRRKNFLALLMCPPRSG